MGKTLSSKLVIYFAWKEKLPELSLEETENHGQCKWLGKLVRNLEEERLENQEQRDLG